MMIEQLIEKKRKYNILLDKLDIILKNIHSSIEELNNTIEHYQDSYVIDDEIKDKNTLLDTKDNLNKIIKNLETIKIRINSKINYLDTEINNYDIIDNESSNNSIKNNSKSKDMKLLD